MHTSPPPSSSSSSSRTIRLRSDVEVWPEAFIEKVIITVAIAVAKFNSRLDVAPALLNMFLVNSTWRLLSESELLWEKMVVNIWNGGGGGGGGGESRLLCDTWREEYIRLHRMAMNFRMGRALVFKIQFDPSESTSPDGIVCCCVTLTSTYLACGFVDGAVRVFQLPERQHIATYRPLHRNRVGVYATSIVGIVINRQKIIFATTDGDIHVAVVGIDSQARRFHLGDYIREGVLASFAGNERYWIGLYTGIPNRAFHVWDANSEQSIFVGGTFTEQLAVSGWKMLGDWTMFLGRVRVSSDGLALACTENRIGVFDLENEAVELAFETRDDIVVGSFDANVDSCIAFEVRGFCRVLGLPTLTENCRFRVNGPRDERRLTVGCINKEYVLMCNRGVIRVWTIKNGGRYLYSLRERIGELNAIHATDRYIVTGGNDQITLFDFASV